MRRPLRFLARAFGALLLLVLLGVGAFYGYLRLSLPKIEGELRLAGLSGPIDILRDKYGIPHIFAGSPEDASFAQGFAHAQDRLWQMEVSRRIAAGRMAEILGPGALETDRFLRTLGVRRSAEENVKQLDADTRRQFEAYAAGVNAFLANDPVLPPEFWLVGAKPEPWTPADSVSWMKMMAWDLGGNWRNELLRMRLAKNLPLARIHQFLPPYPGEAPIAIPDLRDLYGTLQKEAAQLARFAPDNEGLGSNNWVVSGARSETGKPLLANDPHLGLTAPPVWYFAQLSAPGLNVIGASLPGVPGVVLGRNDRIAWGFTNTGPDVQDLYLEKLDNAGGYLTPEGSKPFQVIEETIRVKGAEPEKLKVRVSRHGPVISDIFRPAQDVAPRGYVLSFRWTALATDDLTAQAAGKLARAQDWSSFLAAVRDFHSPQQNIVYADVDGNIGFVAAGRVPVRKPANDLKGMAPAPGWDAKYDWSGYLPFEQLPQNYNPAGGSIMTANHRITPPGYPHFISSQWEPPYRADRIQALLDAKPKHDWQSFARIQADVVSLAARELMPHLLKTRPRSDEARNALAMLAKWDGTMAADLPEPLIVWAWWRELTKAVYADELGDAFAQNWLARAPFMASVLSGEAADWCDDTRTPAQETCEDLMAVSLDTALADLRKRYGANAGKWRWGEAHPARSEHRPFGRQSTLAKWFDIRVPTPGDTYTVNVARNNFNDEREPYASRHAASLRAIYDLADLEKSLFIHSGGQSGNLLSEHYDAFSRAWAKNQYIPMIAKRETLEAAPHRTLKLLPSR